MCKLLMVLRDKLQSLETGIPGRVWGKEFGERVILLKVIGTL